jgi:diadenosine tetraphosphate (Ap4A) HIT family hydrolase
MTTHTDCPLCTTDGGQVVWRDAAMRVVLVDDADYPGFCRVVWHEHVAELSDLDAPSRGRLFDAIVVVERVVRAALACDKVNVASLGNMVAHQHWHVIPRFRDDAHFPQSVWSVRQREVAPDRLAARQAAATGLAGALQVALNEALGPLASRP